MSLPANVVTAVRQGVEAVVRDTPALRQAPELERAVAQRMLGVSMAAAKLLDEDRRLSDQIARRAGRDRAPALATAQAAADIRSGRAVESAAGVLQSTRQAIDFPGFVTNLITGVFQSIQTSNIQQLQAFAELMEAVGSSTEDFATAAIGRGRAAQWAVDRFGVFTMEAEGDELNLSLKEDAEMPDSETLVRVLGATEDEVSVVDEYELGETLIPLVQRKLGRDRQAMLATMIKMGLQRVVVDDGRLHASMRLQVDARSVAEQTQGEQFDTRVETEASGSFGLGNWGASAKMAASVGYVRSDEQYSREDIAVQAGLRSSVDLRFRTLPLDVRQIADDRQLEGVTARSLNPEAPGEYSSLIDDNPDRITQAPTRPTPAGPGSLLSQDRGTLEEARRAREAAQEREGEDENEGDGSGGDTGEGDGDGSADSDTSEGDANAAEPTDGDGAAGEGDAANTEGSDDGDAGENIGRVAVGDGTAFAGEQSSYVRAPSLAAIGGQWSAPGRPHAQTHALPVLPRSQVPW